MNAVSFLHLWSHDGTGDTANCSQASSHESSPQGALPSERVDVAPWKGWALQHTNSTSVKYLPYDTANTYPHSRALWSTQSTLFLLIASHCLRLSSFSESQKSPSSARPSHSSPVSWYLIQSSMLLKVAPTTPTPQRRKYFLLSSLESGCVKALWYVLLPVCRHNYASTVIQSLCHINPLLLDYLKKFLSWVWYLFVCFPQMLEPCRLHLRGFHLFSQHLRIVIPVLPKKGTFKSTFSDPCESWQNHWMMMMDWISLISHDINFHHPKVNSQQIGAPFPRLFGPHTEKIFHCSWFPPKPPNHRSQEAVQLWSLLHQVAKLLSNPWRKQICCNELKHVKAHTKTLKIILESFGAKFRSKHLSFQTPSPRMGRQMCLHIWLSFPRLGKLCWYQLTVLWLSIMAWYEKLIEETKHGWFRVRFYSI